MKQVCLQCGRISAGGDLFCQETYCPGEMSPTILDAGDWFGDIEIVKPIIVLRSAVLYEAIHQKRKVYLKVAHPGAENKERLKREAEFLQALQLRKLHQTDPAAPPAGLRQHDGCAGRLRQDHAARPSALLLPFRAFRGRAAARCACGAIRSFGSTTWAG